MKKSIAIYLLVFFSLTKLSAGVTWKDNIPTEMCKGYNNLITVTTSLNLSPVKDFSYTLKKLEGDKWIIVSDENIFVSKQTKSVNCDWKDIEHVYGALSAGFTYKLLAIQPSSILFSVNELKEGYYKLDVTAYIERGTPPIFMITTAAKEFKFRVNDISSQFSLETEIPLVDGIMIQ